MRRRKRTSGWIIRLVNGTKEKIKKLNPDITDIRISKSKEVFHISDVRVNADRELPEDIINRILNLLFQLLCKIKSSGIHLMIFCNDEVIINRWCFQ